MDYQFDLLQLQPILSNLSRLIDLMAKSIIISLRLMTINNNLT